MVRVDVCTSDSMIVSNVEEIVHWFINYMKLQRFKLLELEFKFTKNLAADTNGCAFTTWTDSHYRPRSFEIEVDLDHAKEGGINFVGTIIHELIHVKQFLRSEVTDTIKINKILWKGQLFDMDEVSYLDLPWEIEAYQLEQTLTPIFLEQTDVWF